MEYSGEEEFVRILKSINPHLSFFALGLCTAIIGPTLMELQMNVCTDTTHITYLFAYRAIGAVIGARLGNIVFGRFGRQIVFPSLILFSAITTLIISWWRNFYILANSLVISGLSLGAINTGGKIWCMDLWRHQSGTAIHVLHFAFGMGAFLATLIAKPLLSPFTKINCTAENSNISDSLELEARSAAFDNTINAYALISGLVLLVAIAVMLILMLKSRDEFRYEQTLTQQERKPKLLHKVFFLTFAMIFAFFLFGVQIPYGQMITTFSVKSDLQVTKSTGASITLLYWSSYALGSAVAFFTTKKLSAFQMLMSNLIIIFISCIILASFGVSQEWALDIGTALLGFGMSPMYGSLVTWMERYVTVSGNVVWLFTVFSATGEMVFTALMAHFMEDYSPFMLYLTLGFCCASYCFIIPMRKISTLITDYFYDCSENNKVKQNIKAKQEDTMEDIPLNSTDDLRAET